MNDNINKIINIESPCSSEDCKKVLIVGVNSQYIHSLLSVYYIQANSKWKNLSLIECNINMPVDTVVSNIISYDPKIVAFSTYIFNVYTSKVNKVFDGSDLVLVPTQHVIPKIINKLKLN